MISHQPLLSLVNHSQQRVNSSIPWYYKSIVHVYTIIEEIVVSWICKQLYMWFLVWEFDMYWNDYALFLYLKYEWSMFNILVENLRIITSLVCKIDLFFVIYALEFIEFKSVMCTRLSKCTSKFPFSEFRFCLM